MSIDEEGRPCVRVDGYESAFTWDEYREVRPLLKLQITMKTLWYVSMAERDNYLICLGCPGCGG